MTTGDDDATDAQLRAELEALRRRNAELEQGRRWPGLLRSWATVILLILGTVLLTLSVPTIWGRNLVLNTDRYVQTLKPLAKDPGVQQAIVKAVDQQFQNNVDIAGMVKDVLPPRAAPLAGPMQSAANGLVNTVATRFVHSDAFVGLWVEVNRTAHRQLVGILTGKYSGDNRAIALQNDTVTLNLAPIINRVKQDLVNAGLTLAKNVPTVGATIDIAKVKGLDKAQKAVRSLNTLAYLLPILGVLCFGGAIACAHRRRRCVVTAALCVTGGMLLLALGLAIGRVIYLGQLPGTYLSRDAAGNLYDILVRYLRLGLRAVLGAALIIVVMAWVTGTSSSARGARRLASAGPRALAVRAQSTRFGALTAQYRVPAMIGTGVLALLILALWTNPSLLSAIVIVLIAAFIIAGLALVTTGTRERTGASSHT